MENQLKALVVDDADICRRITARIISKAFSCEEAENGLVAVKKYQVAHENRAPYDIVFMDVCMPEMDGKQAVRKIREYEDMHAMQRVPIIMISASERIDGIEELVSGLLRKALNKQSLEEMLRTLFDGKVTLL